MADSLREYFVAELKEYLQQEDRFIPWMLATFEEATGIKREHVVYTVLGAIATYLIIGHGAELLCNFIGYAYPAYASFLALQTEDKEDDKQWLTYWTVFGTTNLFDFASDKIMGYFPVYWLVKCVFLLWLYLPNFRGAEYLYVFYFEPGFRRMSQIMAMARDENGDNSIIQPGQSVSYKPPKVNAAPAEADEPTV